MGDTKWGYSGYFAVKYPSKDKDATRSTVLERVILFVAAAHDFHHLFLSLVEHIKTSILVFT